jgi:hypothetical protein
MSEFYASSSDSENDIKLKNNNKTTNNKTTSTVIPQPAISLQPVYEDVQTESINLKLHVDTKK